MIEKDDWRLLRGQEEYLKDKTLYFKKWSAPCENWDHDHCEFCFEKFSDLPESLNEGYTNQDNNCWICPDCFNDFKEMFHWKIIDKK